MNGIVEFWNWIGWVNQTIYLTLASYLATRLVIAMATGTYDVPRIPLITPGWFAIRRVIQVLIDGSVRVFRGMARLA